MIASGFCVIAIPLSTDRLCRTTKLEYGGKAGLPQMELLCDVIISHITGAIKGVFAPPHAIRYEITTVLPTSKLVLCK